MDIQPGHGSVWLLTAAAQPVSGRQSVSLYGRGMDKISWATVAISAGLSAVVSGFVALVADLFARPRLEARKERILERYRARRQFFGCLGRSIAAAGAMSTAIPDGMSKQQQELYLAEVTRQRESVIVFSRELQERSVDFLLYESVHVRRLAALTLGKIRGLAMSDLPNVEAGAQIESVASPLTDFIGTSRVHRLKRRSLLRSAEEVTTS